MIGHQLHDPAIIPENVYNMDETGALLSVLSSLKVLVRKQDLTNYRGAGVQRALVTAVEYISADGRFLLPLITWPTSTVRPALEEGKPEQSMKKPLSPCTSGCLTARIHIEILERMTCGLDARLARVNQCSQLLLTQCSQPASQTASDALKTESQIPLVEGNTYTFPSITAAATTATSIC